MHFKSSQVTRRRPGAAPRGRALARRARLHVHDFWHEAFTLQLYMYCLVYCIEARQEARALVPLTKESRFPCAYLKESRFPCAYLSNREMENRRSELLSIPWSIRVSNNVRMSNIRKVSVVRF